MCEGLAQALTYPTGEGDAVATIRPRFNERLYEFCVNFELVSSMGALIAGYVPGIPSPQDEADLGWDARVSIPTYGLTFLLQYKVANRTTARAGANARFWDCYADEYYRFSLHRDAAGDYEQHRLLLDADWGKVQALYCAPLFHERGELVDAMRTGTVVDRSTLIPISSLGSADAGGPHSVTYPVDELAGNPILHSEPRRGERLKRPDLRRLQAESSGELTAETFERLAVSLIEKKKRRRRRERSIRATDPVAAAYLAASAVAFDELHASVVVLPAQ